MSNVYIVVGSTGEFGDSCEWNVRAFLKPQPAHALKNRLNTLARSYNVDCHQYDYDGRHAFKDAVKALDPQACVDYTGVDYGVVQVPLS